MNAHTMTEWLQAPAAGVQGPFLFAQSGLPAGEAMLRTLTRLGVTETAAMHADGVLERLAVLRPTLMFIDFSATKLSVASELATRVRQALPQLPLVAVGSMADAAGALAALRAGVQEFVDFGAPADEIAPLLQRLLGEARQAAAGQPHSRSLALLAARAGLGTSTLAASLAWLLGQRAGEGGAADKGAGAVPSAAHDGASAGDVALLDLGLPVGDGSLYLDLQGEFSFVDAVRSLQRLDRTLVQTAFSQAGPGGVRVLQLPSQLGELRHISHADASALLRRLQDFFRWQVIDLGGFSNLDFTARLAREASEIWLVCDQSVSAIVATAELVRELAERGIEAERLGVVVNAHDRRVTLTPQQVAQRLGVRLVGALPERRVPLLQATNVGQLLVRQQPRDPYSVAVRQFVDLLSLEASRATVPPARAKVSLFQLLMNRIRHGKRH